MDNKLELFRWWFYDDTTGLRRRTSYAMDQKTATELYGNVQPDEPTRVLRTVYQVGDSPNAGQPFDLQQVEMGKVQDATPSQ